LAGATTKVWFSGRLQIGAPGSSDKGSRFSPGVLDFPKNAPLKTSSPFPGRAVIWGAYLSDASLLGRGTNGSS
jgi:hypothetical protein